MKKILLSLGTIAAIAAPIGAVVSCGDKEENVSEEFLNIINSDLKVAKGDTDFAKIQTLTTDGFKIDEGEANFDQDAFNVLNNILNNNIDQAKAEKAQKNKKFKEYSEKAQKDSTSVAQKFIFTVIKGFANDSIKIKVEVKMAFVKPKIERLGESSKEITITFTA